jgi:Lipocalin-like domain
MEATLRTDMDLAGARSALVGTWRLLSYMDRGAVDEPWEHTFGEAPTGLILYHPLGLLSAQVAAARWDEPGPWTYIGYLGTFEIQEAERIW